jgi:hypothetical protein
VRDAQRLPVELAAHLEAVARAEDALERGAAVQVRIAVDVRIEERRQTHLDGEVLRRRVRVVAAAQGVLALLRVRGAGRRERRGQREDDGHRERAGPAEVTCET